ncbi:MAG: hypothetical protein BA863_05960 [Desulfovibrio sp. S3730MH75]|nr:MAG: hypothetical protein BA863_05960 [Desulfovibrio sp. S3730MH75]
MQKLSSDSNMLPDREAAYQPHENPLEPHPPAGGAYDPPPLPVLGDCLQQADNSFTVSRLLQPVHFGVSVLEADTSSSNTCPHSLHLYS